MHISVNRSAHAIKINRTRCLASIQSITDLRICICNTSNDCKTATSENNTCLDEYIKINLALAKTDHISVTQLPSDSFFAL